MKNKKIKTHSLKLGKNAIHILKQELFLKQEKVSRLLMSIEHLEKKIRYAVA